MRHNQTIMDNKCKKALVAMSGGVDSSVALYTMIKAGYECIGVTMVLDGNSCMSDKNVSDAKAVAERLDVPHIVIDYTESFNNQIIDYFTDCYEHGATPNPCTECNSRIKFGVLLDKAMELSCDYIVTGHYAVTAYDETLKRHVLRKASDENKDQSYFLYKLTQNQLKHIKLPLADLSKDEVRDIAESIGLITAHKKDSQDICFIPDGKYAQFIENRLNKSYPEGDFIDMNGNVLGRHKGIIRYTIGQRKGLGIALNEPMYVKEIDVTNNTVMLARDAELYTDTLMADNINLISVSEINEPMEVTAKIRYRHKPAKAFISKVSDDIIKVDFHEPQRAVTRGQAVVFYDGDTVVGGGTII